MCYISIVIMYNFSRSQLTSMNLKVLFIRYQKQNNDRLVINLLFEREAVNTRYCYLMDFCYVTTLALNYHVNWCCRLRAPNR
jgi:hypothetical protein